MPVLQGRYHVLTIDTAKRPHLKNDDFAAQVSQSQRRSDIQPGVVR
jgi:hypothetical protein